jgi:hypothetical protein
VKSAPPMPFDSEIAPKAKTRKTASNEAITTARNVGWYIMDPMVPVIAKTMSENKTMKKYLLFTRLGAEMGEE